MTRFDITQWCDFVRGLAPAEEEAKMRATLASSGPLTRRTVALLERVAEVAHKDLGTPIPEHALRSAKAAASLERVGSKPGAEPTAIGALLRFLSLSVTFDSLRDAAAVGTRDLQPVCRQLAADGGGYQVDLRIEHEGEAPGRVVTGQLLERERPLADVPVLAVRPDGEVAARTLTSRFGELQLEGLTDEPLALCLLVAEDVCLHLPLSSVDGA